MASKMPFCDVKWHQSGSKKNEYRISKKGITIQVLRLTMPPLRGFHNDVKCRFKL